LIVNPRGSREKVREATKLAAARFKGAFRRGPEVMRRSTSHSLSLKFLWTMKVEHVGGRSPANFGRGIFQWQFGMWLGEQRVLNSLPQANKTVAAECERKNECWIHLKLRIPKRGGGNPVYGES
jgi:hypothetical protein